MKKIVSFVLAAILAIGSCFALASCGKPKSYVLGFDAEYPPFGYEENGEYVGFDIEYAKKVFDKLGYDLELKAIDWDAKDNLLESGAIDMIWSGFTYEGREDDYAWTARYLDNTIVVLVKDSTGIASLADLAGKKVVVQTESSGEAALKENTELVATFKDAAYTTIGDYTSAFTQLETEAIDAIVVDIGVAKYLIAGKTGYTILAGADNAIATETYGVGFAKDNAKLAKEVSDMMAEVGKDTAFIKGLCDKYGVQYESFLLK